VQYGVVLPSTLSARALVDLGQAAETAGWDGVFVRDTLFGCDVWVALAGIAVRTERVRLGPLTTALPRYRPWKLASETVALDHLSEGRLTLPVGLGGAEDEEWDRLGMVEEMERHVRAKLLDEGLDVLTGLWSDQPFSYQGERYEIREVKGQRPLQTPRIPVWVPGTGWPDVPASEVRRILTWDGVVVDSRVDVSALRRFAAEGRDETTPFDVVLEGTTPGDDRAAASDRVRTAADAGATWWVETPPAGFDLASVRARVEQGPPG
jgi:alkanesulfonate monooxygenase SsuD/methylene tetrahydromethanopterin reductase-like flavin-dependent oxidoreductase (luciferase family)